MCRDKQKKRSDLKNEKTVGEMVGWNLNSRKQIIVLLLFSFNSFLFFLSWKILNVSGGPWKGWRKVFSSLGWFVDFQCCCFSVVGLLTEGGACYLLFSHLFITPGVVVIVVVAFGGGVSGGVDGVAAAIFFWMTAQIG